MKKNHVLEMSNVSKSFPGVKALQNVSFNVKPGTVHALLGENGAGKSTLMNCLFGIYSMDEGEIKIDGAKVEIPDSHSALKNGVAMIHQELHPIPDLKVMENVWLGQYQRIKIGPLRFLNYRKMYTDTVELFKRLNLNIDPKATMRELSVSRIQAVEIAKAVTYNAKIIIMDEPTSSLTGNEVEHLFSIIDELKAQNTAIIYISHKMDEILRISDDVTIMRDGEIVGSWPASELTIDKIITRMVGRELSTQFPKKPESLGGVKIRVENLTSITARSFKNVSFEICQGEILGVSGLVGAQRTELAEAIFGLRAVSGGSIYIDGEKINIKNPGAAKKHKIAMLTEERRRSGIFGVLSVEDNTLIASSEKYVNVLKLINYKLRGETANAAIDRLKTKTPSLKTLIRDLSGGNQQKVLFARWLLTQPDIFILDEPTRGIDVGAKAEVYSIIADLASNGKTIMMISSEMQELIGVAHRIMVMCEGRVTGIIGGDASEEEIMLLATKFAV